MVNKTLGYVISIVGVAVIAVGSMPNLKTKIGLPESLSDMYILGAGLLIAAAGIIILTKSSSQGKQEPEVPIYEGKNVVGYRRMNKK